ncbi:ABC transporter ATP-binding protein [Caballeronia mineralivorans]|uniref:ABC transporter ATP-binding protein n=1 Tax=Caballeronia mineralivorans TaxID=2010198 RepID=UPI0023F10384|nr:ABC transporter ATP-binding protein [Caballeronia mineralivorans]MDB5785890.1 Branched-chain amino acid transporter substrate-binding protein [Caballeronia mineralivorans]
MTLTRSQFTSLRACNLTRRFGGVTAVNDVSLDVNVGTIHSVIGTNGAGKSTLINLLCGELTPTSGDVLLNDAFIGGWSQQRRARAGVGRTYQRNNVFAPLSVMENCRLAAQARMPRAWHLHEAAQHCAASNELAAAALEHAGLTHCPMRIAGTLSHGQKRQLEIAMCLAGEPTILLLDEPLAGMGPEETARMLELLQSLRAEHAILLVEHDMDAVFATSDVVTVMVDGAVIASGTSDEIRSNRAVQNAYLGTADVE